MKRVYLTSGIVILIILLTGCSALGKANSTSAPATQAVEIETESPALETTVPTVEAANAPAAETTEAPAPTEEAVINHEMMPAEPVYTRDQKTSDCNTGERAALGATTLVAVSCDDWSKDKLERPVDFVNGSYFPWLDIVSASMGTNQAWMFANVQFYKDAAGKVPQDMLVGLELDLNLDSRGDILVLASGLKSSEWTTNGVQVWKDANGDVGGSKAHSPDGQAGDGYETLLFDSGKGDDPDLAWARIDPAAGATVEFAFKPSLLPKNQVFAWWAWSGQGKVGPQMIEMVDSQSEADLWQVDNTCGWIFNAKPSHMLVNICDFVVPTATPLPTPTPRPQQQPGNSCVEPPGGCAALGPGWIFYKCECVLFN